MRAAAAARSQRVAFVPDPSGSPPDGGGYGGTIPTTRHADRADGNGSATWSGWKDPTFDIVTAEVAVSAITDTNAPDPLRSFDTVVLYQVCDIGRDLDDDAFRSRVTGFVERGGKLVVWDSECGGATEGATEPDYSRFVYPFDTVAAGFTGASGSLTIADPSTLGSPDPASAAYLNTAAIAHQTDAVGDAHAIATSSGDWCARQRFTNVAGASGPVVADATWGRGLIVYVGLDADAFVPDEDPVTDQPFPPKIDNPSTSPGDPAATGSEGKENLGYLWELILGQRWDPDAGALACHQSASGVTLAPASGTALPGTDHGVTASVVDMTGTPMAGVDVSVSVVSGPSSPLVLLSRTGDDGRAAFRYASDPNAEGTDVLEARATLSGDAGAAGERRSNRVTQTWSVGQDHACSGRVWYFAEGTTRAGFDEFILLANPGPADVSATVTYFFADGAAPADRPVVVPGRGRTTVQAWQDVGRERDISIRVTAEGDLVAERSIYAVRDFGFGPVNGSSTVVAEAAPRTEWWFAEGTTLPGFQEYLTVFNPGTVPAVVDLSFGLEDAAPLSRTVTVAPGRRATIDVNDPSMVGAGHTGVSAHLVSSEPVLVERPLYFRAGAGFDDGIVDGFTAAYGVAPRRTWLFAEGNVLPRFRMFLTLANPDPAREAAATVEYLLESGASLTRTVSVAAAGRRTSQVYNAADPGGIGQDVSDPFSRGVGVRVTTNAVDGLVVERPMYFLGHVVDPALAPLTDGTDAPGVAEAFTEWSFAEGTTRPDFRTFVTLANAATATVTAGLTYLMSGRPPVQKEVAVGPRSRRTVKVDDASAPGALGIPDVDFALVVTATAPVVAERPLYAHHDLPDLDVPVDGGSVVFGLPSFCE